MPRFALILVLSFALAACASDPGGGPDAGSPAPAGTSTTAGGDANESGNVEPEEPKTKSGAPLTIVVDKRSGRFYASDDPKVAEIPDDQRVDYQHPFEALDNGFFPDAESDPMSRWK